MKKHILVVDDDTLMTEMVSRCLQPKGYTVTTANSGEEAVTLLESHRFDLILCDIHLNGSEGFAVLAASKIIQPTSGVILCSADIEYKTISLAFRCGADSFLAKPFLASELQHHVGRCLNRKQQNEKKQLGHQNLTAPIFASGGCVG